MAVRKFNGTSDRIRTAVGGIAAKQAISLACLVKLEEGAGNRTFLTLWSPTAEAIPQFWYSGTRVIYYQRSPSAESGWSGGAPTPSDGWALMVVTKAAGSTSPKFYKYVFSTKTLTSQEGEFHAGDRTEAATEVHIGESNSQEFFKGLLAAAAVWNVSLTEAQIKELLGAASLEGWKSIASPQALWLFNQASTAEALKDLIGSANQTAITGTTVVAEEPPIPYKASAAKTLSLTDSITPTESLTKKTSKALTDSVTPSETFSKKATKGLGDTITTSEAWSLELVEPEPEPTPAITMAAVVSEPVDDTLFIKLTSAEGNNNRLSGIEGEAGDIATGIGYSNSAPGGHRSANFSLLRDPRRDFPDLNFIDDLVIYGRVKPLGRNAFEGMTEQFPAQLGDTANITVNAVGNQALLSENEAWKALYVDLGFSNWQEAGRIRKEALAKGGIPQGKISLSTGEDGLVWTVPSGQTLAAAETTEAVYRSPAGCPLGLVGYKGSRVKNWASFEAPVFYFAEDETFAVFGASSTNLLNATPEMYDIVGGLSNAPRWAMLRATTSGAVAPEAGTQQTYSELAAYGHTGVPLREIPGHLPGVYGHDVLAHLVSTGAPDLNYTIGGNGSIVPNTSFVMENFAPTEPGKPWDAIEKLNAYFLNNFGVWDNKEFFWKPWNPEDLNWQISIAGGAQWSPVGRQANTLLNGLVVNYTDGEGINRFAGPPGSGCDYESSLLVNPDPTNPYTRRGRRRWGTLNVGFPLAYPSTAFQVGSIVLAESMMPQRSGSLTIRPRGPGHIPSVTHPTMGQLPVWALRAGDYATLMDWPVPEALRVTQVDYTHDTKTLTAQLDSGAARLTAILERTGSTLTV